MQVINYERSEGKKQAAYKLSWSLSKLCTGVCLSCFHHPNPLQTPSHSQFLWNLMGKSVRTKNKNMEEKWNLRDKDALVFLVRCLQVGHIRVSDTSRLSLLFIIILILRKKLVERVFTDGWCDTEPSLFLPFTSPPPTTCSLCVAEQGRTSPAVSGVMEQVNRVLILGRSPVPHTSSFYPPTFLATEWAFQKWTYSTCVFFFIIISSYCDVSLMANKNRKQDKRKSEIPLLQHISTHSGSKYTDQCNTSFHIYRNCHYCWLFCVWWVLLSSLLVSIHLDGQLR